MPNLSVCSSCPFGNDGLGLPEEATPPILRWNARRDLAVSDRKKETQYEDKQ